MHAQIKRNRKIQKIFNVSKYKCIIENSRKRPKPYTLNHLLYDQFYDLDKLNNEIVQNRNKNCNGEKVIWLHVKWFEFEKNSSSVGYKYKIGDELKYLDVNKCNIDLNNNSLQRKYNNKLRISIHKKDILYLLKQGVIPEEYRDLYYYLKTFRNLNI